MQGRITWPFQKDKEHDGELRIILATFIAEMNDAILPAPVLIIDQVYRIISIFWMQTLVCGTIKE